MTTEATRDTAGDWVGDAEPGGCECKACGRIFIGSEFRSVCKQCDDDEGKRYEAKIRRLRLVTTRKLMTRR